MTKLEHKLRHRSNAKMAVSLPEPKRVVLKGKLNVQLLQKGPTLPGTFKLYL